MSPGGFAHKERAPEHHTPEHHRTPEMVLREENAVLKKQVDDLQIALSAEQKERRDVEKDYYTATKSFLELTISLNTSAGRPAEESVNHLRELEAWWASVSS
jgi:hypothetical protein